MTVDTLQISRRLQAVGASKELAEEQAEILREMVNDQLVTKDYLDARLNRLAIQIIGILTAVIAMIEFFAR